MIATPITKQASKVFGVPKGEYIGQYSGYFVWLYNDNREIFYQFKTTTGLKGTAKVIVLVDCPKVKIFDYKEYKQSNPKPLMKVL
jgi:hypothetical protein